ncbi:uncharacterized protein LOC142222344 [Haematobia irritans]|uniref:uncharacterized protein LOC142222344 n=1 Tax=Haematobia irritans TaxID=7368 RepID=UPI003F4F9E0A
MNSQDDPSASAAPTVKGGVGYILDIIVVRLDISDKDAKKTMDNDSTTLVVEATFNREELQITSSRINVVEFKSGRSFEFVENPHTLKEDLANNKLKLKIKHDGKDFGMCSMDWPEEFLNCIIDPSFTGELTHVFESEFKDCETEKECGTIEVIVRLQTKCTEWSDDDGQCRPMEDISKLAHKVIDPHDILFVVGDDKNPCSCSQVGNIASTESDKSLDATCLDLSNFRAINGKTVANSDVLNMLDPTCTEMKKVTNHYQKPKPCCSKKLEQPTQNDQYHHHCKPNDCKLNMVPSCSSSDTNQMPPRCCSEEEGDFAGDNEVNICHNESLPCLVEQVPVRPRCCPLCKENLSWLPKLAACPKCGYKPLPQFEERPYNDQLTANDILKGFLEKKSSCTEQSTDRSCNQNDGDGKPRCRCTCIPNKICAYCRIRKLCADIYQPNPKASNLECGKCESKSSEMFNICKTSSKDCRPHLTRVFSELKDLYDIRTPKKKTFEPNERCEKELNGNGGKQGAMSSKTLDKQNKEKICRKSAIKEKEIDIERKQFLVKNFRDAKRSCKNKKFYNYNAVRKYPGIQFGHKTCINGYAGRKNVPPNMGWLWSAEATGVRSGWKPGAIRKPIKELMKYFLKDFPADTLRVSQYSYGRHGSRRICDGNHEEEKLEQKPTLHICKKNGEYFITLRPLKESEALRDCADPYLNMHPIQFKIIKNPMVMEMRKLKKCLKEMGFPKCTCHKPICYCFCRSFLEKKRLEYQCNKEAQKRNLPHCGDTLVLSDTTDSEAEFDFGVTPPAGVIRPENLKKRNFVNTGTQYVENDWNVPPLYPKEPNKYMKLYNCAVGERFGKAFGPYGPEGYSPGAIPTGGIYDRCGRGGSARGFGKGIGGAMGLAGVKGMAGKSAGGRGFGVGGVRGAAGGKGGAIRGKGIGGANVIGGGTVDMMRYLNKSKGRKLSPSEMADNRKKRLRELSGVPPPLICMVDRRAKPVDPCSVPYLPATCCGDICLRDNRVC